MSRFRKLSHTIWHRQYHIVWVPKYRHRILTGHVGHEVGNSIRAFSQQKGIEILEMNIQPDHVHLLVMIPPKVSVSDYCGMVKGRSAIRVFNKFKELKQRPYWGNHFWIEGYCVDTFILDSEMFRKYVKMPGGPGTAHGTKKLILNLSRGQLNVPCPLWGQGKLTPL